MAKGIDPQSWGEKVVQHAKCCQHAQKNHCILCFQLQSSGLCMDGMDAVSHGTLMMRTWASENALKRFVAMQKLSELFSVSLQINTKDLIPCLHTLLVTTCLLRLCMKDIVRTQCFYPLYCPCNNISGFVV